MSLPDPNLESLGGPHDRTPVTTIANFQLKEAPSASELLWDKVINLTPGEKIQIVDNLTIEFYKVPFPPGLYNDVEPVECGDITREYLKENFQNSEYCILLRGRDRVAALGLAKTMSNDPIGLYIQLLCGGNISSQNYQKTESLNKMNWAQNQKIDWYKVMDAKEEYWPLKKEYYEKYKQNPVLDGPSDILPLGLGTILQAILINFAITKDGYKYIYNEAATINLARDYYARFGYVFYDTGLCNTTDDEVTIAHKKSFETPPKNIDKEKLALFRACLTEDDSSSASKKFYEKYKIHYFQSDLCDVIDLKLKSLRTPSGSYKMKLCEYPKEMFAYCKKKFSGAVTLLNKFDDWTEPTN